MGHSDREPTQTWDNDSGLALAKNPAGIEELVDTSGTFVERSVFDTSIKLS